MKKVLKCRLKDYYEVTSKLEPWATGKKYPIEQLHVNLKFGRKKEYERIRRKRIKYTFSYVLKK